VRRFGVTAKLLSVVALAIVALAVNAAVSIVGLNWLVGGGQRIYERGVVGITRVSDIALAVEAQSALVGRAPSELNAEIVERYRAEVARRSGEIEASLAALLASGLDQRRAAQVEELRRAAAMYRAESDAVFNFAASFAQEQAVKALQGPVADAERKVRAALASLVQGTTQVAKDEASAMSAAARRTGGLVVGAGLVLGCVVGVASLLIARGITRPLKQALGNLEQVARGDLSQQLEIRTRDEVGQLSRALNLAIERMGSAVSEVADAAASTARTSQQISSAVEQLSTGAQEQASSLEATATSLEEIAGAMKQSADNARLANQLAAASRQTAETGGQVVARAVSSMGEINEASRRIADIITTIDEIAFQTNLLALNAAVEAARAGEQGRGFAVVAAEVRNLAQRSATAAGEIKHLIQDSVQKVEAGSRMVNESGATLGEIVASVNRVTDLIGEIAAASAEQSVGIDRVNHAVGQMDHVVQTNAAQTEELHSTAQSLSLQARELQTLVSRFKVTDDAAQELAHERPVPAWSHAPAAALAPRAGEVRARPGGRGDEAGRGRGSEGVLVAGR
jgi:methyl-accepting chemotaxis protein